MVKDVKTGACYRADHLLEAHLDKLLESKDLDPKKAEEYKLIRCQADTYNKHEMTKIMQECGVTAPETGNTLTPAEPFNLMFQTQIGPTGTNEG